MGWTACALPGRLSSQERRDLPARAFGLPGRRMFPMYRLGAGGELIPSGTHASDARGRARQAKDRGTITAREYNRVIAASNRVLKKCTGAGGRRAHRAEEAVLDAHLRRNRRK